MKLSSPDIMKHLNGNIINSNQITILENIKEIRRRIENEALDGNLPSLELSVEYLRFLEKINKDDSDEYLRAMGYFVFLKDYIYNPLSSTKIDIDHLNIKLDSFVDCVLKGHYQQEIWLSAITWRRTFTSVDEIPVDPLYSVVIGSHSVSLEKSHDEYHDYDVYRVNIDGNKTFWDPDQLDSYKDMNPEFITHDLLCMDNAKALMNMDLDSRDVYQVFAYFRQHTCRVCSKRIDYDGLYSPMLTDERWKDVYEYFGFTEKDDNGCEDEYSLYICLDCMEKALGRKLVREDVNDSDFNGSYLLSRGWI